MGNFYLEGSLVEIICLLGQHISAYVYMTRKSFRKHNSDWLTMTLIDDSLVEILGERATINSVKKEGVLPPDQQSVTGRPNSQR